MIGFILAELPILSILVANRKIGFGNDDLATGQAINGLRA